MVRFLLYAILLWVAYFLVKTIAKSLFAPAEQDRNTPGTPSIDADLVRDPECGIYFLRQKGVKGIVEGKVLHFCSEECYDKYLKDHPARR
ncbi:MAG: hypothetical protein AB9866_10155 [Syntrophobacteraceae bacterium]